MKTDKNIPVEKLSSDLKGAIFDLDGVVVNTVPVHFKAWRKIFSEYEIDFDFEEYKKKVDGISRFEGAKAVLKDHSDDEIKIACDKKQQYYLDLLKKGEIEVYQSTWDLIKELKDHNKKVAIASSSKNCRFILKKIGLIDIVDDIVDGTEITKAKPDPQIFQMAVRKIGCDFSECVVFEDAVLGVEAAKRGDFVCIGVDRYNEPDRLKNADIVVSDLVEINFEKLEKLFSKNKY